MRYICYEISTETEAKFFKINYSNFKNFDWVERRVPVVHYENLGIAILAYFRECENFITKTICGCREVAMDATALRESNFNKSKIESKKYRYMIVLIVFRLFLNSLRNFSPETLFWICSWLRQAAKNSSSEFESK